MVPMDCRRFTLIELLIVIAMIAILLTSESIFFYVCLCQWRIGKGLMIPIDTMYNNIGLSALCFTSM